MPFVTIYQARRQAVPLEMRIEQIRKRDKLNGTAARYDVVEVDRARMCRITVMVNTDWRDPSRYDLVVKLVRVTPDETTHRNVETIIVPGYQPKELSDKGLQNIIWRCGSKRR